MEEEQNNILPFLDIKIIRKDNGRRTKQHFALSGYQNYTQR